MVSRFPPGLPRPGQTRYRSYSALDRVPGLGPGAQPLLDGRLQGKPHTVERTVERWKAQRGRTATLVTGHAVVHRGRRISVASSTQVHFARVSDRDIEAYAATGEPLECAGAFTLEALGGWFIDRVDGDPSGVIGLSLPVLRRALEEFGLSVSDFWTR